MDSDSPCLILADAIENQLCGCQKSCWSVGADIMHYMTSVSGMDSLEGIQQILLEDTSSEGASIFELIIFPDEGFQVSIEGLINCFNYSKDDEKTICELLGSRKLNRVLHFPDIGIIPVTIPGATIQSVIARLNIWRKTDPRIIEALNRFSEEPLLTRCKIRLRNSRWIQSEANIQLLLEVIHETIPQTVNFIECLEILLEFLTTPHPESDIIQALISEKERLIHFLDMADRQDILLKSSTMESIMLQGVRIISIDREEIINHVHILDHVLKVLGRQ